MSDYVQVGYSPNDFFYNTVNINDATYDTMCKGLQVNSDTCSSSSTWLADPPGSKEKTNLQKNCINLELCKNRDNAKWLANTQMVHSGAAERLSDTRAAYNKSTIMSINLAIGIAGIAYVISVISRK
jgi:hypothetical protein